MKFNLFKSKYLITIQGEIDGNTSKSVIRGIDYAEDNDAPIIPIYINSCGGFIHALHSIYNRFNKATRPIATFTDDESSSAAAFLLAAGTPGFRWATINSHMFIHYVCKDDKQYKNLVKYNRKETHWLLNKMDYFTCNKRGYYLNKLKLHDSRSIIYLGEEILKANLVDNIGLPIITI